MEYQDAIDKYRAKMEKYQGRYESPEALLVLKEMYKDVFGSDAPPSALMCSFGVACNRIINAMHDGEPLKDVNYSDAAILVD